MSCHRLRSDRLCTFVHPYFIRHRIRIIVLPPRVHAAETMLYRAGSGGGSDADHTDVQYTLRLVRAFMNSPAASARTYSLPDQHT